MFMGCGAARSSHVRIVGMSLFTGSRTAMEHQREGVERATDLQYPQTWPSIIGLAIHLDETEIKWPSRGHSKSLSCKNCINISPKISTGSLLIGGITFVMGRCGGMAKLLVGKDKKWV